MSGDRLTDPPFYIEFCFSNQWLQAMGCEKLCTCFSDAKCKLFIEIKILADELRENILLNVGRKVNFGWWFENMMSLCFFIPLKCAKHVDAFFISRSSQVTINIFRHKRIRFFLNILTVDLWSVMMRPGHTNILVFAFSCGRNDSFLLSHVHLYASLMSKILFFWNMSFDNSFLKTKRRWLYIWSYPLC